MRLSDVRLRRLFRIGRPELHWVMLGVLGCALTGSIMPVFAFFYGEVFHVSTSLPCASKRLAPVHLYPCVCTALQTFTLRGEALHQSAVFWTCMFLVLATLSACSSWLQLTSLTWASERLVVRMRLLAFRNLLHQTVAWFDRDSCSPDKLANRLARDAPTVKAVSRE